WIQLSIIAILSVIVLGACGNNETGIENKEEANESENTYTIGVTQLLEHPSLDNAYEGFQEAIEEAGLDVEYDYQKAQNDQNNVKTIADNFLSDNVNLIFDNSTHSAQCVFNSPSEQHIILSSLF